VYTRCIQKGRGDYHRKEEDKPDNYFVLLLWGRFSWWNPKLSCLIQVVLRNSVGVLLTSGKESLCVRMQS